MRVNERLGVLSVFLLVLGAVLFGYAYFDSASVGAEFAHTCPSGALFPAQTCMALSARLQLDGGLMATGVVVLLLGAVLLALSLTRWGQAVPDIPVHFFGPRSK